VGLTTDTPEDTADRLDHVPPGHRPLFVLLDHLFGQIPLEPLGVVHEASSLPVER
jgi:hypothetical protein